jgi:Protein of unknown function (DUF4230)
MASLIGKGASLIVQILFVVAIVLVFSYFDPFDLLVPTKKTLENTPIQLSSIKEIGQLITAEYYGEVIASLDEVIGEEQAEKIKEFNYVVDDLHENFLLSIEEFIDEKPGLNKKDNIYNSFMAFDPDIGKNKLFHSYLYFIREKIKNRKYNKRELDKQLNTNLEKILIKRIYKNSRKWRDKLFEIETSDFKQLTAQEIKSEIKKTKKNRRLVIIGRGWVKAGFDFGTFTENNFHYNPERKTIHFIGLKPEILSKTINPWFIPEERVEGFEFLIAERGVRFDPVHTKMVKQRCLDKLEMNAMQIEILGQAQKNAENNLKAFFALLLDEEIKTVSFHTDVLDYTWSEIRSDSLISNNEILTIDSVLLKYGSKNQPDNWYKNTKDFIDSLKLENIKKKFYGIDFVPNSYASLLFRIVEDRKIDSFDCAILQKRTRMSFLDTLWHVNTLSAAYILRIKEKDPGKKGGASYKDMDSLLKAKNQNEQADFDTALRKLITKLSIAYDSAYFFPDDSSYFNLDSLFGFSFMKDSAMRVRYKFDVRP